LHIASLFSCFKKGPSSGPICVHLWFEWVYCSMLKIGQLAQIKGDSPYVYEALTQIVNAVNSLGRATGVDPSGTIAAPVTIGSLNLIAADGIFDLAITDNSSVHRGIFYFAESDTTPAFSHPRVYFLGSSRNLRVALGNQTLYWRAYSQYLGSEPSRPVTFGTPPTAVTGGGTATGPQLQASTGSGTATGSEGGSGFGQAAASNPGPVLLESSPAALKFVSVRIREYTPSDLAALRRMHATQGFGYPFPDLESPLFLSKLVLEDDREESDTGREVTHRNAPPQDSPRVTMAVLLRLTAETYLLHDPEAGTPRRRWRSLLAIHEAARAAAAAHGLDDVQAFLPPRIAGAFGRRLARLGWTHDPWPCFSRRVS